jgi:hypothetical protein
MYLAMESTGEERSVGKSADYIRCALLPLAKSGNRVVYNNDLRGLGYSNGDLRTYGRSPARFMSVLPIRAAGATRCYHYQSLTPTTSQ